MLEGAKYPGGGCLVYKTPAITDVKLSVVYQWEGITNFWILQLFSHSSKMYMFPEVFVQLTRNLLHFGEKNHGQKREQIWTTSFSVNAIGKHWLKNVGYDPFEWRSLFPKYNYGTKQ